ncbi:hypothetical protein JG687_00005564 [Phytophthora cactorum]|uniref:Uncharacterized protein n=1 Tax=Phytophthora cactorum TaxID=29920 RepID=A0A329SX12_9STRA|nr:hypothetical protein JG687_00005564 [Phytophthora cactorum]RAW41407.1 hypothetical protein PC110_g2378 [Phytophthora cactorum]
MGVPLVGCASHRYNLAVRSFLAPNEDDLDQVQLLMKHLRTIKQAAKLRYQTEDPSQNPTAPRYALVIHVFYAGALILSCLKALKEQLSDVESVSKKLQCDDLDLLDVRDLRDGLLEIQSSFSHYLKPNVDVVHSLDFELGVVKVLLGQAKRLRRGESSALQPLKKATKPPATVSEPTKLGFAGRIPKRRKTEDATSEYELLDVIPPTTNIVERLFSSVRMILRYERNRLSSCTLEMIHLF